MTARTTDHAQAVKRFEKELLELQVPAEEGSAVPGGAVGRAGPGLRGPGSAAGGSFWRRAGLTVAGVLLPTVATGLLLGAVAWRQFPLEYELNGRVTCDFATAGGPAGFQRIIRELQAPPLSAGDEAAGPAWPFGELLSIASVHFQAETTPSALRIRVETAQPRRARQLLQQWIEERLAVVGVSDAAERIDALLASLPADGDLPAGEAREYRQALVTLRETRERLLEQQRTRADKVALLADLRRQPPGRGVVDPQRRREALAADVGLQQDLRHLQARSQEVRRAVMEEISACLEAAARVEPAAEALRQMLDHLQARGVDLKTAAVLPQTRAFMVQFEGRYQELKEVLAGSREGLAASEAEEPQVTLDVLDRLDTTVRQWMELSEVELARQKEMVDGLTEGQEPSVRRVLIHNRLKRGLFALETGCRTLADRLSALRGDWNFQLDALSGSVRGLSRRVAVQRRHIEERLQAQADQESRRARQAEIARLEEEVRQVEEAEHELLARFLDTFEVMTSLEGAFVYEEVSRRRSLWMSVLRKRLDDFSGGELDGVVLGSGDFVLNPEPLNTKERVRRAAVVGCGGALACLLALAGLRLFRRVLTAEWFLSSIGARRDAR